MPLPLLDAALRGMLLALLALLAAVLVRERPALPAARVGVLMALGLGLQVVSATPAFEAQVSELWQAPLIAVSVANAVLFWVFVQALFDDDFALRPVHAIAWGGVAGLSLLNCLLNCVLPGLCQSMPGGLNLLLHGAQRAVPLVFAVLALVAALAHWRGDLVEGRRRLRWFIVGAGAAYTLVMLAARLGSPRGRLSAVVSSLDVLMLLLMLAVMAWGLLGLGRSEVFAAGVAERPAAAKSPDRPTTLRRPVLPVVPVAPLLPVAPPLPLVPLSPVVPLTPLTPLLQPLPPLPPLPPEPRAAASADPHTAADPAADPDAAPDAAPPPTQPPIPSQTPPKTVWPAP